MSPRNSNRIKVEITLSRPAYRAGSTVVGTVRVYLQPQTSLSPQEPSLTQLLLQDGDEEIRNLLQSLELVLVGRCKLDSRWHSVEARKNWLLNGPWLARTFPPKDAASYCFWSTDPVDLLAAKEREQGRWNDSSGSSSGNPCRPIRLNGEQYRRNRRHHLRHDDDDDRIGGDVAASSIHIGDSINVAQQQQPPVLLEEKRQLAYTFRVDLPSDLPHTMIGTSCRYSYAVGVRYIPTSSVENSKAPGGTAATAKPKWHCIPFTVWTSDPDEPAQPDVAASAGSAVQPHFRLSTCSVLAHSSGLPFAVTASELHGYDGQLSVNRYGAGQYGHVRRRRHHGSDRHDGQQQQQQTVQTMRVADPSGRPVCVLTMIGTSPAFPGSRFVLKFDFPVRTTAARSVTKVNSSATKSGEEDNDAPQWVPCYQVSACLEGEEVALKPDGISKTRARAYRFDTAHEDVDPDCTERVCLHLLLPLDAPCTLKTNVVQVLVRCIVDISVLSGRGSDGTAQYQNLRLEVPCEVKHGLASYECKEGDEDDLLRQVPSIAELMGGKDDGDKSDPLHPAAFRTDDIRSEMKILSLHMANRCGLRPMP